jgi:peptide/nickel transport system ATP-binding protein
VFFEGQEITHARGKQRQALRQQMQIIFQDPYSSLDARMNVQELIAEPLKINHLTHGKQETEKKVLELMETVGLDARFRLSYPHELDGGRRQRIGIARALAVEPKFLVCDEPVSALDVSIQAQILNLMMDLQQERGLTYIFITHNLSVVKHISDDILVMYSGTLAEKCTCDELFERPLHPYTKGLLTAIPVPSLHVERTRIHMEGEVTSPINPKPGCRFASRCPYATEACRTTMPATEEILPGHFVACHNIREINHLA